MLDKSQSGLLDSINFLDKQPEIIRTGSYKDINDLYNIRTQKVNDITFSYIGITNSLNGLSLPSDSNVKIVMATEDDLIKELTKKAKEISDVLVVNVHWGDEYTHTPNDFQKTLAKK